MPPRVKRERRAGFDSLAATYKPLEPTCLIYKQNLHWIIIWTKEDNIEPLGSLTVQRKRGHVRTNMTGGGPPREASGFDS